MSLPNLDHLTLETLPYQFCSDWLKDQIRKLLEENEKLKREVEALKKTQLRRVESSMCFEECFENDRDGRTPPTGKFPENYEPSCELIKKLNMTFDTIEDTNHSQAAENYVEDTRAIVKDFETNIEKWQSATPKQLSALANILRGAERWCR